jgi:D-3-phosphoglycerate dehydrogenase
MSDPHPARVVALNPHAGADFVFENEALGAVGVHVEGVAVHSDAEALAQVAEADVLIPMNYRASRELIAGLRHCRLIASGGIGVDHIDVSAATEHGILVTNMADLFVEEVANHTWMLLLMVARRGVWLHEMSTSERWTEARAVLFPELQVHMPRLTGQTLGLISFGRIARAVARRGTAFGMSVVAFDPYVPAAVFGEHGVERAGLDEVCSRSDVVSCHLPLSDETHHLIGAAQFACMRPGSIFISIGRGPVVDEAALIAARGRGCPAGAGLDVFEHEPPDPANPLLHMPNVTVSPHMASVSNVSAVERRRLIGAQAADALAGRVPKGVVNPDVLATWSAAVA